MTPPPGSQAYASFIQALKEGREEVAASAIRDEIVDLNARDGESEWTPLCLAVGSGMVEVAKLMIGEGADVNGRSSKAWTPLHFAAECDDEELAKILLEEGADVNARTEEWGFTDGWTPLHLGAGRGLPGMVTLLLDGGAKTEDRTAKGGTALHVAVKYALDHSADDPASGAIDTVRLLVQKGADVNAEISDEEGGTALQLAARFGGVEIVEFLLRSGASAPVATRNGESALHMAAKHVACVETLKKMVKLLVAHGADVNAKTSGKSQRTPLTMAIEYNGSSAAKALIEAGADVNLCDSDGTTSPLHLAARRRGADLIEMLVAAGADLEAEESTINHGGITPLIAAYLSNPNRVAVVRRLLELGASPDARHLDGSTALHRASTQEDQEDMARVLVSHGADLEARNRQGWTPLHCALRFRNVEVAEMLLEAGADVAAVRGDTGVSAMEMALGDGLDSVAKLIFDKDL